jgi:hypothetical protein
VEVTTRYATTVDHLTDVWAFVMERIDNLGSTPSITVRPMWVYGDGDDGRTAFEVVVEGTTNEPTTLQGGPTT